MLWFILFYLFSYYVQLDKQTNNPLHSTWSKPDAFAKLIRNMKLDQVNEDDGEEDDEILEESILRDQGNDDGLDEIEEDEILTARESR